MNPRDNFVKWFMKTTEKEKLEFFFTMDACELEMWIEWLAENMYMSKPYYIHKSAYDIATTIRYCKYKMN